MSSRRRHVDPIRVHLITLVIFGVIAGFALALWTFPRFFVALVLLAVSVFVYARLYGFIEQRLEAEEGRLAAELGFGLEDDDETEIEIEEPPPKRRRRKPRAEPVESAQGPPVAAAPGPPAAPPLPLPPDPAAS